MASKITNQINTLTNFLIDKHLQKDTGSALANMGAHLDLSAFSSWEELASLGLDRLKSALLALGLKCGG